MTYLTVMAFSCTLASTWEIDLSTCEESCNIQESDRSSWRHYASSPSFGAMRDARPRGSSFDRGDRSWRSPPGSPAGGAQHRGSPRSPKFAAQQSPRGAGAWTSSGSPARSRSDSDGNWRSPPTSPLARAVNSNRSPGPRRGGFGRSPSSSRSSPGAREGKPTEASGDKNDDAGEGADAMPELSI